MRHSPSPQGPNSVGMIEVIVDNYESMEKIVFAPPGV